MRFTSGILLVYFLSTYFFAELFNRLFPHIQKIFHSASPGLRYYSSLFLFLLLSGLFILFRRYNPVFVVLQFISRKLVPLYKYFWLKLLKWHAIIFLILAVYWFVHGMGGYRYSDVRVSENLSLPLLLVMIYKMLFTIEIWRELIFLYYCRESVIKYKYLIFTAYLLSLTGTTSALTLCIYALIIFFPRMFYKRNVDNFNFKKVVFTVFVLCLLVGGFIVGVSVKTGQDINASEQFFNEQKLVKVRDFLIMRFSTTYSFHTYMAETDYLSETDYLKNFSIPFKNIAYRFSVLLGNIFHMSKPEYARISQLTYREMMLFSPDNRSGASPGLIPGFMFIMPFWLAVVFSACIMASLTSLFYFLPKSSLFIPAITMLFFLTVFKATVDLMNIIDPNFFQFVLFLGAVGYIKLQFAKRRHINDVHCITEGNLNELHIKDI